MAQQDSFTEQGTGLVDVDKEDLGSGFAIKTERQSWKSTGQVGQTDLLSLSRFFLFLFRLTWGGLSGQALWYGTGWLYGCGQQRARMRQMWSSACTPSRVT